MDSYNTINENIAGDLTKGIKDIKTNIDLEKEKNEELEDLYAKWVTSEDIKSVKNVKEFKTSNLSDKEYEELSDAIDTIKKDNVKYDDYKKAFDKLCKTAHILSTGVIITHYKLKKGNKPDNNIFELKYSYNVKKIKLPEGTLLYHMSKTPNIKKLKPQFKGKSAMGYLYDKPRVYFTIHKNMSKLLADYKPTDKMHKYLCKDNIKDVYVDPLVWNKRQGAVYVVTNNEINVEELKPVKENDESSLSEKSIADKIVIIG